MRQGTLILLKPDAVRRSLVGAIIARIEAKGYRIEELSLRLPTEEQLRSHYAEHQGKPFYEPLLAFMSAGPLVALVASGERVVEGVRALAGATDPTEAAPGSIRGDFGCASSGTVIENLIHASDSREAAEREIHIWFPEAKR